MIKPRRHFILPDQQIKPGLDVSYLDWYSQYVIDKKPDVIVIGGDWADMPSLSSYDVGKKSFEGRSYREDILAANDALQRFMAPIEAEVKRTESSHKKRWKPRRVFVEGNHEYRIPRAIESDRKLDGLISTDDLFFKQWGFEVYPFLQPVEVDGIVYCHYFCSGVMGRPITTARALLTKLHQSCFAFHQQGRDIAYGMKANGKRMTAVICGSGSPYPEAYLNPQTNNHWRGCYMANEVLDGEFDEMPVSLEYLRRKYAQNARSDDPVGA